MGKKHKKRLKELERLRALHEDAQQTSGDFRIETPIQAQTVGTETPLSPEVPEPVAPATVQEHNHVKKDLVFLIILIVVMIAALVALNWAIDNTVLGSWLLTIFGQ